MSLSNMSTDAEIAFPASIVWSEHTIENSKQPNELDFMTTPTCHPFHSFVPHSGQGLYRASQGSCSKQIATVTTRRISLRRPEGSLSPAVFTNTVISRPLSGADLTFANQVCPSSA